jgi:hypothetical protein
MTRKRSPEHVALHVRLRAFLLAEMPLETPDSIAGALMYELTSLAATVAIDPDDAKRLIRTFVDAATAQIDAFGVGGPHP